MNNQEIFDKVINHLRTQKYPANIEKGCVYWDKETNRKCAVGCLILDHLYLDEIDECGMMIKYNVPAKDALNKVGIDLDQSMELLNCLQILHDSITDVWDGNCEYSSFEIAKTFKLIYTPI